MTERSVDPQSLEKWQPLRGPFTRWPRFSDALLAVLSFALTMAIWSGEQPEDGPPLSFLAFSLFVVGNGSLYWRRRFPVGVHGIVLATSGLAMWSRNLQGPIFALAISLYALGRYADDDRHSTLGLGAAYLLLIAGEIVFRRTVVGRFPHTLSAVRLLVCRPAFACSR